MAFDDAAQILEDTLFTIDVLDNDTDVDSPNPIFTIDPRSVIYTGPGILELNSDNKRFTYKTALDSTLPDSFKYKMKDGDGLMSNEASVSIAVIGLKTMPQWRSMMVIHSYSPLQERLRPRRKRW